MFAQGRHGELCVDGLWELKEGGVAVFIMPLASKMKKSKVPTVVCTSFVDCATCQFLSLPSFPKKC